MNTNTNRFNLRSLVLILALVVLLFAGIRATGAAAQAAIPGDALYPVKTTIEQTRLSMASDAGDRAQMKMAFAEQRLNEITSLINEGRYREINQAVLAFEADINGAILELETLSRVDPARSARLALEITSALTRYAQNLSTLATSAPDAVKNEVTRALTSTHTASGLDLPDGSADDNMNSNENDSVNGDDHGSDNLNVNNNADDSLNANSNDNGDDSNSSLDDNSNSSVNNNGDDSLNANSNDYGYDDSNTNTNSSLDDNSNANTNSSLDDNSNNNSIDDNGGSSGNDNGYDDHGGGNSGKGGG